MSIQKADKRERQGGFLKVECRHRTIMLFCLPSTCSHMLQWTHTAASLSAAVGRFKETSQTELKAVNLPKTFKK